MTPEEHRISRREIAPSALKVLYRLHREGFEAYLVGGSVRDLLLGRSPKDFDIGTDARPDQVRRLFRNSRIIGRRFRLVHVIFHDTILEVSTFRRTPDPDAQSREDDLVTSDNTYGSPREDAFRRDFTVNGLFYRVGDRSVADYVGGIEDLDKKIIRVIGEPQLRFREDPVRMFRACEFAGRLDFGIEVKTADAIQANVEEIRKASPARMIEELVQLLVSGSCAAAFDWMFELELLDEFLPEVCDIIQDVGTGEGFSGLLDAIDRVDGENLSQDVMLAAILVPGIVNRRAALESRGHVKRKRLDLIVERAIADLLQRFALSNVRRHRLFEILTTFQRLCEPMPDGNAAERLASRHAFADACDLFAMVVDATGGGEEALTEWQELRRSTAKLRSRARPPRPRKRRRGRRRRR
ncbi:MAG: polynucleotide adenylyltransferase PcnB [Acidobacteriota bacterium]